MAWHTSSIPQAGMEGMYRQTDREDESPGMDRQEGIRERQAGRESTAVAGTRPPLVNVRVSSRPILPKSKGKVLPSSSPVRSIKMNRGLE